MYCATHEDVETRLSCQKCGRAICPRCMVQTPVGYRCPECARVRRNPLVTLTAQESAQATVAAAGAAFLGGIGWGVIKGAGLFGLLGILASLAIGYVIAEAVNVGAGRKFAPSLPLLAAGGAALAYLIGNAADWVFWSNASFGTAIGHFDDFSARGAVWGVLSMLLSMAMAYSRLRR